MTSSALKFAGRFAGDPGVFVVVEEVHLSLAVLDELAAHDEPILVWLAVGLVGGLGNPLLGLQPFGVVALAGALSPTVALLRLHMQLGHTYHRAFMLGPRQLVVRDGRAEVDVTGARSGLRFLHWRAVWGDRLGVISVGRTSTFKIHGHRCERVNGPGGGRLVAPASTVTPAKPRLCISRSSLMKPKWRRWIG